MSTTSRDRRRIGQGVAPRGQGPLPVLFLSVAGVATILLCTRWGIGLSPDSVTYLDAARNLLWGRGFSALTAEGTVEPVTHWPPLFPVALAAVGTTGIDLPAAARWLNATLFGANILLVGLAIDRCTGGAPWIPALGAFLMLTSADMLLVHSMAWSEPLFILITLVALFLLAAYPARPLALPAAAAASGLAFLARYPGGALIPTGIAAVALLGPGVFRGRVRDTLVFGLLSSFLVALWFARNLSLGGSAANRSLQLAPAIAPDLKLALLTFMAWAIPGSLPASIKGVVLVGGIAAATYVWITVRRLGPPAMDSRHRVRLEKLPAVLLIFLIVYFTTLSAIIPFYAPQSTMNRRTLAPLFPPALILALSQAPRLLRAMQETRSVQIVSGIVLVALTGSYLARAAVWVAGSSTGTRGELLYASRPWKTSDTIRKVQDLPEGVVIYSNGPDAIYLLAGRPAKAIPRKVATRTGVPNPSYPLQLQAMREDLREPGAVVVYLRAISWRGYLPSERELQEAASLVLVTKAADGAIYTAGR